MSRSGIDRPCRDSLSQRVKLILVGDHVSYQQALKLALPSDGDLYVAAIVDQPEQAGVVASRVRAHVALFDADIPGAAVLRAIAAVRRASACTGLVAMTRSSDPALLGTLVLAGAAAIVPKTAWLEELLLVVRTVANGATSLPAGEVADWLSAADSSVYDRYRHGRAPAECLSKRERQVLDLLSSGADTHRIAEALVLSPQTVQTHIRNMLGKLGVPSRLAAVLEAQRIGLVQPPSGELH